MPYADTIRTRHANLNDVADLIDGVYNNSYVYPQNFGAVGDGVADDTQALQDALDEAHSRANASVIIPPGRYKITTGLTCYSNVSVVGCGDSSVLVSGMSLLSSQSMLNFIGSTTTSTTLTANATVGTRQVTVSSSANFVADEYVYIVQSNRWAMLHRVKTVDDATHITFHEAVSFPFLSGDTVQRGDWKCFATVRDLRFEGRAVASDKTSERYEDHAVNCWKAHHISVTNCSFEHIGSRAIMFIDKASQCIASNNRVFKCYDRAIESHHNTNGNIISNNVVEGGLIGISVEGIGTVCTGNTCTGQWGYDAADANRGSGITGGETYYGMIANNVVLGSFTDGINLGSDVYYTTIANNLIAGARRNGIFIYGGYAQIIGNSILQCATQSGDSAIYLYSTNNTHIANNRIDGSGAASTYAIAANSALSYLGVGDNWINNFSTTGYNVPAGTLFRFPAMGIARNVTNVSGNTGPTIPYDILNVNASGGNRTITLPPAGEHPGKYFGIAKIDSSANTVTVTRSGSDTINGATTYVLTTQWQHIDVQSDGGTSWQVR